MLMRLFCTLCVLSVCLSMTLVSAGQELKLSPEEYIDGNQRYVKVLGAVGDKTACFLENYDGYRILWYDSAMRKVATSKLDFLDRGAEKFRFYIKSNAIQVFYQRKKRKKRTLWAARIVALDKDTIVPVIIDSIELRGGWDKQSFKMFATNHDNRVAYARSSYDNKQDEMKFEIVSLGHQLEEIHRVKESLTNVPFHMLLDIAIDKQDGLHVFFGEPSQQENKWQKILVGSKSSKQSSLGYKKLDLKGKFIAFPRFIEAKSSGHIHLGGLLYQGKNEEISALGHFLYNTSNHIWETSLVSDFSQIDQDQDQRLNKAQLRNFLLKADGGATFILERSYEERHQRNRSMGMMPPGVMLGGSSYSVFHDDEIYAISTNSSGAVDWTEMVLKSQESSDANGRLQSFGMLQYPMGNIFLFNDQQNSSKRFITAYLSNTGELKLRQFSSAVYAKMEEDNMLLRSAQQVATNQIVFPVIKRGALSFAKIVF